MNNKTRNTLSYYIACVRRYPKNLIGVACTIPLTVLVNAFLPPLIVADVISKLSRHSYTSTQLWPVFGKQLIAYFIVSLLGIVAWRLVDRFMWRLEAEVERDIAEHIFRHLITESADFHANNFSGSLVSQANKLANGYVRVADTTIYSSYPMVVGLLFTNIFLLARAPVFVIFFDIFTICYLAVAIKISKPVRAASAKFSAMESKQTGFLADAITNVMTIKSYARGHYEHQRFHTATSQTYQELFKFARSHRGQMNRLGMVSRTISGSSLILAVVAVIVFKADIGTMFLILSYTARTVDQLFEFGNTALRSYSRALGDAADMVEMLGRKPEITDPVSSQPVTISSGTIKLKNVNFQHKSSDDILFKNLNLAIKQGEKVGVVGHSGSGKTTLTRLLLRFSDVQAGHIEIGGYDISRISQDDLHRSIAYVPQEPLLFHRTIGENIAYGRENASQNDIVEAARYAHAHEFIETLPKGYDTLVGERGVKLSGGQRQRVAIARAMLKDAPVLLLDEATSALDSESEVLIQQALWKLMEGRTAIVIAHRLSTIQKMDRIIVLDKGAIIEQGTHHQLLQKDGTYAKLWAHQSGGFIED